ncbi:MAG: hypothetical protein E7299_07190 [Lachnospiraceae bacterium]|nr:hypothetical protein [Lachnospiraceae bacterium]
MSVDILLSSAVIAAIISGIVSYLTTRRQGTLQYITGERKEWRGEIKKIASNLNHASYKETLKLLTELKVRINAFGNEGISFAYSDDAHIWELINEIECEDFDKSNSKLNLKLKQRQRQLIEYLSLLLKDDWERSKKEVKGDIYKITSLLLFSGAGTYFAASVVYLNEDNIGAYYLIPMLIGYALIIIIAYFLFVLEAKLSYLRILDGNVKDEPKKYRLGRLICCYIIEGILILATISIYIEALDIFLDVLSCGENETVIRSVSGIIFISGLLLLYYSKTISLGKIYNYSNAINIIRIKYQEDKETDKDKLKEMECGCTIELASKVQE